VLKPSDFTQSAEDGCRLTKEARGRFYQAWARARQDWPNLHAQRSGPAVSLSQLCRHQVDDLRHDLKPMMPKLAEFSDADDASV
jgi:CRISPR-associated protein Cas1